MLHLRIPRALCALSLAAAVCLAPVSAIIAQPEQQPVPAVQEQISLPDTVPSARDASRSAQYQRYLPKLLRLGYSQQEADILFQLLPTYRIPTLLCRSYAPRAADIVMQSHFRVNLLDRYLRYAQVNSALTARQVVTQVNIGLDRNTYTSFTTVREPGALDVLVNKYNALPSSFRPKLELLDSRFTSYAAYLQPDACRAFTQMAEDARTEGIWLYCVSGYRSYDYQQTLYQSYTARDGQRLADTYSARPGFSEHQTGLAVDINTSSSSAHFEDTAQYRWLVENSWKYGFILRYPQGKAHITGFRFEPWHYRYVGSELARAITKSGLTYDEYIACRPAHDPHLTRSVTVGDTVTTPQRAPVELDGVYYLGADTVAQVLDLEYTVSPQGQADLTWAEGTLTLYRDNTVCLLNGAQTALKHPPFVQGGQLLIPVEDTAPLLGFGVTRQKDTLLFSPLTEL